MAPRAGLEPATYRLTAGCSTIELSRNALRRVYYTRFVLASQALYLSFLFQVILELLAAAGMAKLPQSFGFDLANPFPGDAEFLAYFL